MINTILMDNGMRWARHAARIGEKKENAYGLLIGKPERRKTTRKT
jgi:hypothetical protein